MTDHKAEWVLVPREPTQEWRDTVANLLHIGDAEMDSIHAALLAAAPAASEGEDGAVAFRVKYVQGWSAWKDTRDDIDRATLSDAKARGWPVEYAHTRPAAQVAATPKHGEGLLPCPFCGGSFARLKNTHSASFWVECDEDDGGCRAKAHGEFFEGPRRRSRWSYEPGGHEGDPYVARSLSALHPEFRRAAESAIAAWNRRALATQPAAVTDECGRPMTYWGGKSAIQPAARRVTDDPLVAELIAAAEGAEALIGVMFGSAHGRYPETIDTPLGIPVKVGKIAASLRAALESFAQPAEGVSGG